MMLPCPIGLRVCDNKTTVLKGPRRSEMPTGNTYPTTLFPVSWSAQAEVRVGTRPLHRLMYGQLVTQVRNDFYWGLRTGRIRDLQMDR
jgi:hypothetical protein